MLLVGAVSPALQGQYIINSHYDHMKCCVFPDDSEHCPIVPETILVLHLMKLSWSNHGVVIVRTFFPIWPERLLPFRRLTTVLHLVGSSVVKKGQIKFRMGILPSSADRTVTILRTELKAISHYPYFWACWSQSVVPATTHWTRHGVGVLETVTRVQDIPSKNAIG